MPCMCQPCEAKNENKNIHCEGKYQTLHTNIFTAHTSKHQPYTMAKMAIVVSSCSQFTHSLSLSHCQCVFPSFYSGWLLWLFSTPQYLNVLYNNCSVQLNFVAWRIKSTFFSSSIEFCSIFSPNEKFPARNSSKFHKSIVEPVTRQEFISTS